MIYIIIVIAIILIAFAMTRETEAYLDNNATTPICRPAAIAHYNNMHLYNASSQYAEESRQVLEDTRKCVLKHLFGDVNVPYRVIITSGASESNNLWINSLPKNKKILVYENEHKTSLQCAMDHDFKLFKKPEDILDNKNVHMCTMMAVNNETGNRNDVEYAAKLCKDQGIWFHTDIVQYFGKMERPFDPSLDMAFSISMHKLYGPLGVGFLVVPTAFKVVTAIHGAQNDGLRGGTENVPACAAAIAAMNHTLSDRAAKNAKLSKLKQYLMSEIVKVAPEEPFEMYRGLLDEEAFNLSKKNTKAKFHSVFLNGDGINTVLVSFICKTPVSQRFCNIKLREYMTKNKIFISIGSACNTGSSEPSHVLINMAAPFIIRCGVIRLSLGDNNTRGDVDKFVKYLKMYLDI